MQKVVKYALTYKILREVYHRFRKAMDEHIIHTKRVRMVKKISKAWRNNVLGQGKTLEQRERKRMRSAITAMDQFAVESIEGRAKILLSSYLKKANQLMQFKA